MRKKREQSIDFKQFISDVIDEALDKKFKAILDDITYRIGVLYDVANGTRVTSTDLNVAFHVLDGFLFEDNKPTPGYVQWTDCNIVYKGTKVTIQNGNTNKKYIWWDYDANPNNVFQCSDTKPTLTDDDVLVCVNEGGVHYLTIGQGKMRHGATLVDSSVDSNIIKDNAITATKILDGAIGATKIASSAVGTAQLAANAVDSTKLANSAVTSTKLASGAVTSAAIASGAVTSSALASGAVTSTALASGAVNTTHLANKAVDGTKMASGAVGTAQLANNAVDSTKLADGSVVSSKIGAGAVATDKLNLAQHLLF